MRPFRFLGIIAGLFTLLIVCGGWGFLVHRTVAQLAVYQLPQQMKPFFHESLDYLVRESVRPDLRRSKDPAEGAKHFIDLEMYGDSAAWKMPLRWEDALQLYSKDSLLKYGYVPYVVIMLKNQLTQAFRKGDKDSILYYAADLSHYIGDAHVPLHTTVNYDGQLTDQKGLHALWETMIPEMQLEKYRLYSGHRAKYLANPELAIWEAVRRAQSLLTTLFEQEKMASREFSDSSKFRVQLRKGKAYKSYSSAFANAYSERLGNSINEQLLGSANLIADFWYTSWVDAGKPQLEKFWERPLSKADKAQIQLEDKAYRNNQLLEKQLLLSRKNREAGAE